jgi:hypothetical protein
MAAQNIEEALVLLEGIIADYRARRSPLAYFPALYRAVTLRVKRGIARGEFEDGARMDRFDTLFANRYFAALDAQRGGVAAAVPKAWRVAFGAEARAKTTILQHLLLGVNAHINFDLPFAASAVAPGAALPGLHADYLAINAILAAVYDEVQQVIDGLSPLLHILDHVGGRSDEAIANFSIVTARDEAWHEATRLNVESGDQLARSARSLDRRAALIGDRIILPGAPIGLAFELIARTESADVGTVTDALLRVA